MIGERLGGKIKHGGDFRIAIPALLSPGTPLICPRVRRMDRGAMSRWPWPDFDRENHRAPGPPSLQTAREYGAIFAHN